MKNKVFNCHLETITPIHIGSGKNYFKGFDFEVNKEQVVFYDMAKVHEQLARSGPTAVEKYENELRNEHPSLERFFQSVGWRKDAFVRYRLKVSSKFIRDIKGQMKTGLGKPIIPGSSLKGAFRTAILTYFLEQHPEEEKRLFNLRVRQGQKRIRNLKQKAATPIVQEIFGDSPNTDQMRQVVVSDVEFEKSDLNLFEMKIANLTQNGYGFLNMSKKYNEHPDNWRWATSIVAEAVQAGARSKPFILSFDHFLKDYPLFHSALGEMELDGKFLGTIEYHYKQLAEKEYEFFEAHAMKKTARFYEKYILEREFESSEVLLRVGWGGGWRFMTGDWVTGDQLNQIRREYGLGKRGHPVFPKSRRLIIQENFPQIPLGWAVLHLDEW